GTGSGCIAVAILHEHAGARAVALDLSPAALRVARRNAERHGVAGRVELIESDCFDALREEEGGRRFDLIASNPPYVPERDLDGLQREVRDYEPRLALTPGGDGLGVIRRLLAESPRFLAPRGHLLFEIGFGQRESVARLVDARAWEPPRVREDLQGIPRAFVLRRRGPE
ncbi:MAG TPA: HemK/PrmC family methyltransferase, partial [Pyrinomonadaceae bacterium]|nr:HemK/PrmC family methyltransferase [Pyrinomonadaceae bacterium]